MSTEGDVSRSRSPSGGDPLPHDRDDRIQRLFSSPGVIVTVVVIGGTAVCITMICACAYIVKHHSQVIQQQSAMLSDIAKAKIAKETVSQSTSELQNIADVMTIASTCISAVRSIAGYVPQIF